MRYHFAIILSASMIVPLTFPGVSHAQQTTSGSTATTTQKLQVASMWLL